MGRPCSTGGAGITRIRSFKPEMVEDEALGRCSVGAQLLFDRLIMHADDAGQSRAAPDLLRGKLLPYQEQLTSADIDSWVSELEGACLLATYMVRGQRFLQLRSFGKHQRLDNAAKPLYPSPEEADDDPPRNSAILRDPPRSSAGEEGMGEERRGEERDTPSAVAGRIFAVWVVETHHLAAKLTADRRRKIAARLREGFTEEDLTDAVRGVALDPWPERVNHNDLAVILRDGAHLEKFRDLWRLPHPVVALPPLSENPIDRRIREFGRGLEVTA